MKKSLLLTSLSTIAACASVVAGATYALFTSESKVNVAVTSGTVSVVATAENFKVYSGQWNSSESKYDIVETGNDYFTNGGFVDYSDGHNIAISGMSAMDYVTFDLKVENKSDIEIKYQTILSTVADTGLFDELDITLAIDGGTPFAYNGTTDISSWTNLAPGTDLSTINVRLGLPEESNAQGLSTKIEYSVYAIQANAHTEDPEQEEGVTYLYSIKDLYKFRDEVNAGNNFSRKTVKLMSDFDLAEEDWTPIGASNKPFSGTFDGNGHTIYNLTTTNTSKSDVGFFGLTTNGLIKNVVFENASVKGYLNVAVVAGTPYTSKYENIKITGLVQVDGFSYVGSLGGKNAYANITDVTIDVSEDSYVRAESGMYRSYVGGLVGFMGEGSHSVTNVTSNIDVYGSTCDVGGIVGIAHYGNSFVNCHSTGNVYLTNGTEEADANEIGGIAGVWHPDGNVTINACTYKGTLSSKYYENGVEYVDTYYMYDGLVGAPYNTSGRGVLVIDGVEYTVKGQVDAIVNKTTIGETLSAAKAAGETNITIDAQGNNIGDLSYGFSASNVPAGTTVTLKNAKVVGKSYGNGVGGTVIFENCSFKNPTGAYSIHFDSGNGTVIFNDCTFSGWNSFGSSLSKVEFNKCEFRGNGIYACVRTYSDTDYNGCRFDMSNTNVSDVFVDVVDIVGSTSDERVLNVNACVNLNGPIEAIVSNSGDAIVNIDGVRFADSFDSLKAALADGAKEINIAGEITLEENLNATDVTFFSNVEGSTIDFDAKNITGSNEITYRNLTLKTHPRSTSTSDIPANTWYGGIDYKSHSVANYIDCTIEGVFTAYSATVNATGCTFNSYVNNGEEYYNVFVYASNVVNLKECTFMYRDRAIKVFADSTASAFELNVDSCKFVATEDYLVNKALINIDGTYFKSCVVNVSNLEIDEKLASAKLYSCEKGESKVTFNTL